MNELSYFDIGDKVVVDEGKIYPWGGLRMEYKWRLKHQDAWSVSTHVWSPALLPFATGEYRAINDFNNSSGWIDIFKKGRKRKVFRLPWCELRKVEGTLNQVLSNGYLCSLSALYSTTHINVFNPPADHDPAHLEKELAHWVRKLNDALAGNQPSYCDNSSFTKVSEKLSGKLVIMFETAKHERLVFLLTGEPIPFLTHCPLSFSAWGVTMHSHFENYLLDDPID